MPIEMRVLKTGRNTRTYFPTIPGGGSTCFARYAHQRDWTARCTYSMPQCLPPKERPNPSQSNSTNKWTTDSYRLQGCYQHHQRIAMLKFSCLAAAYVLSGRRKCTVGSHSPTHKMNLKVPTLEIRTLRPGHACSSVLISARLGIPKQLIARATTLRQVSSL